MLECLFSFGQSLHLGPWSKVKPRYEISLSRSPTEMPPKSRGPVAMLRSYPSRAEAIRKTGDFDIRTRLTSFVTNGR